MESSNNGTAFPNGRNFLTLTLAVLTLSASPLLAGTPAPEKPASTGEGGPSAEELAF